MEVELEMPNDGIDWKTVLGINFDQLVDPSAAPSYVTRTINATLPSILYGAYNSLEDEEEALEAPHLKALLLAQLNTQVLYQTHSHLQARAENVEAGIEEATLRLEETHREFTRKKFKRKRLRKQLEELEDMTNKYRLAISFLDPSTLENSNPETGEIVQREEEESEEVVELLPVNSAEQEEGGMEKWEQSNGLCLSTPSKKDTKESGLKKGCSGEEEDSVLIGTIEKKGSSAISMDSLNAKAEEEEAEDSVLTGTLEM